MAVGDSNGTVDLWDVTGRKLMRSMPGHADRISTMKWNNHVLATGSRRGDLFLHDVRIAEHHIATLEGHSQEVCDINALRVSNYDLYLLICNIEIFFSFTSWVLRFMPCIHFFTKCIFPNYFITQFRRFFCISSKIS